MSSTPMFEQYHALKAAAPEALLLYRMGDFYEMFFDDAVVAAPILEIALTSRNRNDPEPIPMAGVPHHAIAAYVEKLTDAGYRVAIADQVEAPTKGKLVRREIVRIVTPGIPFDPATLQAHQPAWLAVVCRAPTGHGIAFLDVSTGDLRVSRVPQADHVVAELERMEPRELLIGPEVVDVTLPGIIVSPMAPEAWGAAAAWETLTTHLGPEALADLAGADDPRSQAAGVALQYARTHLGGPVDNVHQLQVVHPETFMVIDESSRRNLEIRRTLIDNRRKGSLLGLLDQAATPMGSRRVADWLRAPLLSIPQITRRQDAVAALVRAPGQRQGLRDALGRVADIERIVARVAQGSAHPRDLGALGRSLDAVPGIVAALASLPDFAASLPKDPCADVARDLGTWLVDDPPLTSTEGGLIRPEADAVLAELTELALDGMSLMGKLEDKERKATQIPSLKIKRNRVFGYFIEVTSANLHRVPDRFKRKQTLSGCERYITAELETLQEKVLGADERRKQLEFERFLELRGRVGGASARLLALASDLARLDALAALAQVAVTQRWVRPEVVDGYELDLTGARHPMVEVALDEERFVPNDVHLDPETRALVILTGPNMSGKSTVLRQTALIVLLAQIGAFVPADTARIGICDRIFSRVGAADDLRRGQSTFMVEMSETATILHHATRRSLVVLDEIGRGTSTFDGLAIAWSVAEDLVDRIGCKAMFATHYHELCELAELRPLVANQCVAVTEVDGTIVFLRRLQDGGASRSYGVQCARIAGLPAPVLARAEALLQRFEDVSPTDDRRQLALFAAKGQPVVAAPPTAVAPSPPVVAPEPALEALRRIDPDAMTPREAHAALYGLRDLLS